MFSRIFFNVDSKHSPAAPWTDPLWFCSFLAPEWIRQAHWRTRLGQQPGPASLPRSRRAGIPGRELRKCLVPEPWLCVSQQGCSQTCLFFLLFRTSESRAWVLVTTWCTEPGPGGVLSIAPGESMSSRQRFRDLGGSPLVLLLPPTPVQGVTWASPGSHPALPTPPALALGTPGPSDSSAIPGRVHK